MLKCQPRTQAHWCHRKDIHCGCACVCASFWASSSSRTWPIQPASQPPIMLLKVKEFNYLAVCSHNFPASWKVAENSGLFSLHYQPPTQTHWHLAPHFPRKFTFCLGRKIFLSLRETDRRIKWANFRLPNKSRHIFVSHTSGSCYMDNAWSWCPGVHVEKYIK